MKRIYLSIALSLMLQCFPALSFACGPNEYEQCWRIELGPLGEAKDCRCYPKFGGDVAKVAEDAKKETNRLIDNLARELNKTPDAIRACLNNVPQCAGEILSAPLALPAQAYFEALYRQSQGKVRPFPSDFIALVQPYYEVDLRGVTWALNMDTGHGQSLAYCDRIFFVTNLDWWNDRDDLHHVLHEIEHLGQCTKRGKRTFLTEYILKVGLDIVKTGRPNVHDIHDYEVAAEAKAEYLTDIIWTKIRSGSVPLPKGLVHPHPGCDDCVFKNPGMMPIAPPR